MNVNKLRVEIGKLVRDSAEMERLRNALNGPDKYLNDTKLNNWIYRRLPKVAIEGAAIGMRLCLKYLDNSSTAVEPDGFSNSFIMDSAQGPPAPSDGVPKDLMLQHRDAITTTRLYGDRTFHFAKIDHTAKIGHTEGHQPSGRLGAKIWRFFDGVKVIPLDTEPKVRRPDAWLVHGSTLDADEGAAINWEEFGFKEAGKAGRGGVRQDTFSRRVDFLMKLLHGEPATTCGYSYEVSGRFLTEATKERRTDGFSGANALAVLSTTVAVSMPRSLRFVNFVDGIQFALPMPILPRNYIDSIAEKARRGVLGDRHALYTAWAKPAAEKKQIDLSEDLWEFAEVESKQLCSSIKDAGESLFKGRDGIEDRDRIVFAARFDLPNPLTYQSVLWMLPEAQERPALEPK